MELRIQIQYRQEEDLTSSNLVINLNHTPKYLNIMASKQNWKFHIRDVKFAKKLSDTFILNVESGNYKRYSEADYKQAIKCSANYGSELGRVSNRKPPTMGLFETNDNEEIRKCVAEQRARHKLGQLDIDFP